MLCRFFLPLALLSALMTPATSDAQTSAADRVREIRTAHNEATRDERWRFSLLGGTQIPTHMGARVEIESPSRFRLGFGLGVIPRFYVEALNATVVGLGGYDRSTAEIVADTLQTSLVMSADVGFRPFAGKRLVIDATYLMLSLGGNAAGVEVLARVTDQEVPAAAQPDVDATRLKIRSTLHMIGVNIGGEWTVAETVVFRAWLGVAFTASARTRVNAQYEPRNISQLDSFEQFSEDYLDEIYSGFVHTATLGIMIGFRAR
ncbi:MAG: hypothetical protein ACI81R_001746 [Bradymonadia bacterium]|jgi:hypothetical protein